jgi:hypothetical protein
LFHLLQVILDTLGLAGQIKKTPVVVGNCTGFAVNRVFFPYTMAACLLADLGQNPYEVRGVGWGGAGGRAIRGCAERGQGLGGVVSRQAHTGFSKPGVVEGGGWTRVWFDVGSQILKMWQQGKGRRKGTQNRDNDDLLS